MAHMGRYLALLGLQRKDLPQVEVTLTKANAKHHVITDSARKHHVSVNRVNNMAIEQVLSVRCLLPVRVVEEARVDLLGCEIITFLVYMCMMCFCGGGYLLKAWIFVECVAH